VGSKDPAYSGVYWRMVRAIFDESASYLTIPLQSLRFGRSLASDAGQLLLLRHCFIATSKRVRSPTRRTTASWRASAKSAGGKIRSDGVPSKWLDERIVRVCRNR
jgi:hypothetical protein